MSKPSKRPVPFNFLHQNPVELCTYPPAPCPLPPAPACHEHRQHRLPVFNRLNDIWWGGQIMKLLVMHFSPVSRCVLLLRPKHISIQNRSGTLSFVAVFSWQTNERRHAVITLQFSSHRKFKIPWVCLAITKQTSVCLSVCLLIKRVQTADCPQPCAFRGSSQASPHAANVLLNTAMLLVLWIGHCPIVALQSHVCVLCNHTYQASSNRIFIQTHVDESCWCTMTL